MLKLVKYNEGLTQQIRERKIKMIEEVRAHNAVIYEDLSDDFDDFNV